MYRIKNKRLGRSTEDGRVVFQVGDEIEPTESELKAFADNLQKIPEATEEIIANPEPDETEESNESKSEDTDSESVEDRYPDLSQMNVNGALIDYLKGESFSAEEIEELHNVEKQGADRISAHQRIDEYA